MQLDVCFEHKMLSILFAEPAISFPRENKTLEESSKTFHAFTDSQTPIILLSLSCCSQVFLVSVFTHSGPSQHLVT